ncbi:hypothetical protein EVAR_101531_1 [Eumeta japonica]|uniref:Uncharacterized protein n=1 Tax=Eumeta variegata TaxID=151549 RepID=A0A4C1THI8_EUMVA|nr:hypothetical protein EVAR_101531_1 [Eumeta japonica]
MPSHGFMPMKKLIINIFCRHKLYNLSALDYGYYQRIQSLQCHLIRNILLEIYYFSSTSPHGSRGQGTVDDSSIVQNVDAKQHTTKPEDDILGIPGLRFPHEEMPSRQNSFLEPPRIPLMIPQAPQIPPEYFDDPVLRTFYNIDQHHHHHHSCWITIPLYNAPYNEQTIDGGQGQNIKCVPMYEHTESNLNKESYRSESDDDTEITLGDNKTKTIDTQAEKFSKTSQTLQKKSFCRRRHYHKRR